MGDFPKRGDTTLMLSTGTIFRVLLVLAGIAVVFVIRHVVFLVLGALFIALLIEPFADALERRRLPRSIATLVVYAIVLAIVVGLASVLFPPAIEELRNFLVALAPYEQASSGLLSGLSVALNTLQGTGWNDAVPQLFGVGSSAVEALTATAVLFILAYYFVAEKQALFTSLLRITPKKHHVLFTEVFEKVRDRLGAWLRGQLALMVAVFVLTYIALTLIGVPYALLLALFAGVLEVIPFLGPLFSAIPAIALALSLSPLHALIVALAYVLIQSVEGQVLVPKIMQRATGMNPVFSLLAVLVGFTLGGVAGAILALPLANAGVVFAKEIHIL